MNKFLLLFFLAVFSISVWSQGLVAHYPLNGNANDSSGNGNDGTLNGVTFASNNTMTFAQFTSTSYINVPDNSTFDFSNASGVTIATWIRQEQSTSGDILRKMGTSGSSDDEYGLWLSSTGQISGGLNGPGQQKILQAKSSLSLNTWTHVVFMWNKVDSKISFYINGILDTITNSTITSIQNTNAVLRIGAWVQSYLNSFTGSIDDIRIYNRALSYQEILQLYNPSITQGLVAHYPFSGNANDSSGNGNDGTLNGVTFASNNTMTFAQFTSTSYINVPDNSTFDFSNASGVTIATWIRQEQSTSGDILRKMGTSGSSDDEYGLWLSSTGQISGGLNGPGQQKILQAKSSLSLNTWTHVVFMWNKVDSKISFYINGILDTITNSTITSIQNTNAVLRIGAWVQSYLNSFTGSIDDIRIYNRALSYEEIQILYGSTVDVKIDENMVINDYYFSQNYPNPFNPSTTFKFIIRKQTQIRINVYNVIGELVRTLGEGLYNAGSYELEFKANDLPSGIYLYQLAAENFVETKKMILLK